MKYFISENCEHLFPSSWSFAAFFKPPNWLWNIYWNLKFIIDGLHCVKFVSQYPFTRCTCIIVAKIVVADLIIFPNASFSTAGRHATLSYAFGREKEACKSHWNCSVGFFFYCKATNLRKLFIYSPQMKSLFLIIVECYIYEVSNDSLITDMLYVVIKQSKKLHWQGHLPKQGWQTLMVSIRYILTIERVANLYQNICFVLLLFICLELGKYHRLVLIHMLYLFSHFGIRYVDNKYFFCIWFKYVK